MKIVYVTYDTLKGKPICIHSLPNITCPVCEEYAENRLLTGEVEMYEESDAVPARNCIHFDECQGRNKCCNPKANKRKCFGICRHFEPIISDMSR